MRYILLAFLLGICPQVRSEIVYGQVGIFAGGNNGEIRSNYTWGQSFTNANYVSRINSIALYLNRNSASGTLSLSIYAAQSYTDSGNRTGYISTEPALSTSNSIDVSTIESSGLGLTIFTGFSSYDLTAGNRYVYQINSSNVTGAVMINAGVPTNSLNAGQNRYLSTNGGSSYDITGDYNTLTGYVDVTAVPEPTTFILSGGALAAGAIGAYFKRRRKANQETTN